MSPVSLQICMLKILLACIRDQRLGSPSVPVHGGLQSLMHANNLFSAPVLGLIGLIHAMNWHGGGTQPGWNLLWSSVCLSCIILECSGCHLKLSGGSELTLSLALSLPEDAVVLCCLLDNQPTSLIW